MVDNIVHTVGKSDSLCVCNIALRAWRQHAVCLSVCLSVAELNLFMLIT